MQISADAGMCMFCSLRICTVYYMHLPVLCVICAGTFDFSIQIRPDFLYIQLRVVLLAPFVSC